MTAYLATIKLMARYLSTKYPDKNSTNQREGKKGIEVERNEDDPKSEDEDSITACTAGAHIGGTAPPENSTASSGGARISAHISKANEQSSRSPRSVEKKLGAHPLVMTIF